MTKKLIGALFGIVGVVAAVSISSNAKLNPNSLITSITVGNSNNVTIQGRKTQALETIVGNGVVKSIDRTTGEYDTIVVRGPHRVRLEAGQEGRLTLSAEENILDQIVTEVQGKKLVIATHDNVNLQISRDIEVIVPFQDIDAILLSGSGHVVADDTIKTSRLTTNLSGSGNIRLGVSSSEMSIKVSGSGDVFLTGDTHNINATIAGSGRLAAFDLTAQNAEISVAGSGDVDLFCTQSLVARITGSGDVRYRGNPPTVESKTIGSGKISRG